MRLHRDRYERLCRIVDYMLEHPNEPRSVLAEAFNMSGRQMQADLGYIRHDLEIIAGCVLRLERHAGYNLVIGEAIHHRVDPLPHVRLTGQKPDVR